MKLVSQALGLCSIILLWTSAAPAPAAEAKLTGWFACEKCTASRVAKGDLRPSNPDCAQKCINEGSQPVFISEQGKELLKVRNYESFKDNLGYHVEITGEIDPSSKTITIGKVTQLEYEGASCSRPRSGARK